MKVIIAGGSGFVGSHFIQYMVGKYSYSYFYNLDIRASAGRLSSVEDMHNYRYIRGDISERDFVFKLFAEEKTDIVINFVPDCVCTANLLEACRLFGIRRFHHAAVEPYAVEAEPELLLRTYCGKYDIHATFSRSCWNYGPFCGSGELITAAITRALRGEAICLEEEGTTVRDWLYVSDHCRAIDLIINEGRDGELYYIGGDSAQTDLKTVRVILKILDQPESLIWFGAHNGKRGGRYVVDSSKIMGELGWVPSFDFETGVRRTILWYVNHQDDILFHM